jgi:hypothetical protein
MKRVFSGSVGHFLLAAPHLKNLNKVNIELIAKRLKISNSTLNLLLNVGNTNLN